MTQGNLFGPDAPAGAYPPRPPGTPTRICDRCRAVVIGPPTMLLLDRAGREEHRYQTVYLCRSCDEAVARLLAGPAESLST
jgi:hypothetical protein